MSLLNEICNLAKVKNAQALMIMLEDKGVCIDFQEGAYSPIMLLAQQGEHEAVDFLLNRFNADRQKAIQGYAIGGHATQANALLAQENISARRHGTGGQLMSYVARAYAKGGHTAQVEALLAQGASLEFAVNGYASGGHIAQVNELFTQNFIQVDNRTPLQLEAIKGYAAGGYVAQVNELLAQDVSYYNNSAVYGYAQGGYTTQVDMLLARGVDQAAENAVHGYAECGYIAQVNALLVQNASCCEDAIRGYAKGGYIAQVNALLAQETNPSNDSLVAASSGYSQGGHLVNFENSLRLVILTNNLSLREKLLAQAGSLRQPLLNKVNNISQLIEKNHLSYCWARAFTPALNFLFLQGHLLMQKQNLSLNVLLYISSFISGFSSDETYRFLSRHFETQSTRLKVGRDTSFFRRQALLVNTIENTFKMNINS